MKVYFAEWNADYEKLMIDQLQLNYDVILFNKVMKHFRDFNLFLKQHKLPRRWLIKSHQFIKLHQIKSNDILLCNGFSISGFIDLIKDTPCHRVLILRDTIAVLEKSMKQKKRWLGENENYIDKIIPHFDKVYSFDYNDCQTYHFDYLNQFLPFTIFEMQQLRSHYVKKDIKLKNCFFIGEFWQNRADIINFIAPILQKNGYSTDFNLINYQTSFTTGNYTKSKYFKSGLKMSYLDNIEHVKKSNIILEIPHRGQTGTTLRAIEAILFNKKLITTNSAIKNYDFYSPEQIYILDDNFIEKELIDFLQQDFTPIPLDLLYKYSADAMLETVCNTLN